MNTPPPSPLSPARNRGLTTHRLSPGTSRRQTHRARRAVPTDREATLAEDRGGGGGGDSGNSNRGEPPGRRDPTFNFSFHVARVDARETCTAAARNVNATRGYTKRRSIDRSIDRSAISVGRRIGYRSQCATSNATSTRREILSTVDRVIARISALDCDRRD